MSDDRPNWTFLSNHAHVMILLDRNCDIRIRDIALEIGITERAVQRILGELLEVGAIRRERVGRRNHYELNRDLPLRHRLEAEHTVGDLLEAMAPVIRSIGSKTAAS